METTPRDRDYSSDSKFNLDVITPFVLLGVAVAIYARLPDVGKMIVIGGIPVATVRFVSEILRVWSAKIGTTQTLKIVIVAINIWALNAWRQGFLSRAETDAVANTLIIVGLASLMALYVLWVSDRLPTAVVVRAFKRNNPSNIWGESTPDQGFSQIDLRSHNDRLTDQLMQQREREHREDEKD